MRAPWTLSTTRPSAPRSTQRQTTQRSSRRKGGEWALRSFQPDQAEGRGPRERRQVKRRAHPRACWGRPGSDRRGVRGADGAGGSSDGDGSDRACALLPARTHSSQTTKTSSMMSACHRYSWAKLNTSVFHCPRQNRLTTRTTFSAGTAKKPATPPGPRQPLRS